MNSTSTSTLQFIPQEHEKSEELSRLFANVHKLISDYLIHNPDKEEKVIRRFVAGDVCREDLNQFAFHFVGSEKEGRATPWTKFVQRELKNKKRKFSEMSEISKDFQDLKVMNPEQISVWEDECQQENQKMTQMKQVKDDLQIRPLIYRNTISNLKKIAADLLNNFNTHVLLYLATDTVNTRQYPPLFDYNSNLALKAHEHFSSINDAEPQSVLTDIITLNGVKSRIHKVSLLPNTGEPDCAASSSTSISSFANLSKKELLKMIRRKANDLWHAATGKKSAKVPWLAFQDATNKKFGITGWPEQVGAESKNGRFDFDKFKKEDLLKILEAFMDNKISFQINLQ